MPHTDSQTFLRDLDKKLWGSADKKGAQASRLSLEDGKDTGKMPVLHYKITSTGKLIDNALEAVEKENVNGAERHRFPARGARRVRAGARIKLKNVLNKNYTQLQIDPANLAGLIDLIATIPFQHADLHAKDILGHAPKSSLSNSHSAPLGDLCASAVKNSSIGNANFAWVQHMLHHLAPNGSMALLLANGSMSSNSSGEGEIRRALIEADLVECMVVLPGQLFTNTQIPACIWFLTKNKAKRGDSESLTNPKSLAA